MIDGYGDKSIDSITEGIPKDWKAVPIKKLCNLKRGASPRPIDDPKYFSESGRGWIRISDVTSAYKYLNKTQQYLSKIGESKSVKVNPGDVIMSICATIGKPIILKLEACIHDGFVFFNNLRGDVYPEYFFYFLLNNEIEINRRRQIGTQGNLNTGIVNSTIVSLPSFDEQIHIAKVLAEIDKAIGSVEQIITKHERIKEGLMQDLFTKGIDKDGNIRSEETHKFRDSPLGRIPEEWDIKTLLTALNNISSLIVAGPFGSNLKVSDYRDEGIPIIRLQNIERNEFKFKDMKYISEEKAKALSYHNFVAGDIVLAKLGDPIGKTCIIPEILTHGIVVADVVRIRSTKNINKEFLVRILNSRFIVQQLTHDIIGTTRPRVNLNQVRDLSLFLPSKEEQDRIGDKLSRLDYYINFEKQKLSKLKHIKTGLMQDLLTGKVRVNNLIKQEVVA